MPLSINQRKKQPAFYGAQGFEQTQQPHQQMPIGLRGIGQFTKPVTPDGGMIDLSPGVAPDEAMNAKFAQPAPGDFAARPMPAPGATNLPAPPPISRRARMKDLQLEEQNLLTVPVEDKDGRLRTGVSAMRDVAGMVNFGDTNSWGDLAGKTAALGGAFIGGLINKKYNEKRENNKAIIKNRDNQKRMMGEIKLEDEFEENKRKAAIDNAKLGNELYTGISKRNKDAKEMAESDGVITEEEAADLRTLPGMKHVEATDQREFDYQEVNGITVRRPKKGAGKTEIVRDMPIDEEKAVVPFKTPYGNTVKISQGKFADKETDLAVGDANRQMQAQTANQRNESEYLDDYDKYSRDRAGFQGEVEAATTEISTLDANINEIDQNIANTNSQLSAVSNDDENAEEFRKAYREQVKDLTNRKDNLLKQRRDAESRRKKAETTMKGLQAPKKGGRVSAPNVGAIPKMSKDDFLARAKKRLGNNPDAIEKALADAQSRGIIQ